MEYVGVDVSKKVLEVGRNSTKRVVRYPNTPEGVAALVGTLDPGREQVVLEPTSTYHYLLVQALARAGLRYKVINPAHTKAFAQAQGKRAKTDQVDARLLAAYGESQKPEPSPGLDEAQEELKALRRHLEWLEDQAQMVRGRLEAARHSPWTPKEVARSLERTLREREEEVGRIKEGPGKEDSPGRAMGAGSEIG